MQYKWAKYLTVNQVVKCVPQSVEYFVDKLRYFINQYLFFIKYIICTLSIVYKY